MMSAPVRAQATLLSLNPSTYAASLVGEIFTLNITIENVENLWSWKAKVTWDPAVLDLVGSPVEGDFLTVVGSTIFVAAPSSEGEIPEISGTLLSTTGASGAGVLARLSFEIEKKTIESAVNLVSTILLAPGTPHPEIGHGVQNAKVNLVSGSTPIAHAGEDQVINEGVQAMFNGSRSIPQETGTLYTWSFFDAEPKLLEGMVTAYPFEKPGVYAVTLTVTNNILEQSNDTILITVKDITAPVAVISVDKTGGALVSVGEAIEFSASQSYDPESGDIHNYLWDFGDGDKATAPTVSHEYNQAATYTVTLTVVDRRGNNAASTAITIIVGSPGESSSSLPPAVIGLLIVVTAIVVGGSVFWLRKANIRK
jgi:hypothetical protein